MRSCYTTRMEGGTKKVRCAMTRASRDGKARCIGRQARDRLGHKHVSGACMSRAPEHHSFGLLYKTAGPPLPAPVTAHKLARAFLSVVDHHICRSKGLPCRWSTWRLRFLQTRVIIPIDPTVTLLALPSHMCLLRRPFSLSISR
jgi:hypothetical protein